MNQDRPTRGMIDALAFLVREFEAAEEKRSYEAARQAAWRIACQLVRDNGRTLKAAHDMLDREEADATPKPGVRMAFSGNVVRFPERSTNRG